MSADLIVFLLPGILYIVFAFRAPPKALDHFLTHRALFSLFPEPNRVKHGRLAVGALLILVALGGLADAIYSAVTLGHT